MGYVPDRVVLERYARLLVEFGLGGGAGIERGDVVQVRGNDACKPLLRRGVPGRVAGRRACDPRLHAVRGRVG